MRIKFSRSSTGTLMMNRLARSSRMSHEMLSEPFCLPFWPEATAPVDATAAAVWATLTGLFVAMGGVRGDEVIILKETSLFY